MWVEDTEWNKKYTRQLEKDQSRVDGGLVSIEDKEQRKYLVLKFSLTSLNSFICGLSRE